MSLPFVRSREAAVTLGALERFFAGVSAPVCGEVVRAGEALAAAVPVADEGSVPSVDAHMPRELVRTREGALAACEGTFVNLAAFQRFRLRC